MRGGAVAARRAHNPKVPGSSPGPATRLHLIPTFLHSDDTSRPMGFQLIRVAVVWTNGITTVRVGRKCYNLPSKSCLVITAGTGMRVL